MREKITKIILPLLLWSMALGSLGALAAGSIPVAENFEFAAPFGGTASGQLTAYDPDGDELIFYVTTEPRKGTLVLSPDGSFFYTPGDGKKGRDYFGYRVEDTQGDRSQEATVIIRIEKK